MAFGACTVQDFVDENATKMSEEGIGDDTRSIVEPVIMQSLSSQGLDYEKIDIMLSQKLKLTAQEITREYEVDYDRIELEMRTAIIDQLNSQPRARYQFLCDENERWIYRCNRMTGEIECFSMSSNKLRLLSSTR